MTTPVDQTFRYSSTASSLLSKFHGLIVWYHLYQPGLTTPCEKGNLNSSAAEWFVMVVVIVIATKWKTPKRTERKRLVVNAKAHFFAFRCDTCGSTTLLAGSSHHEKHRTSSSQNQKLAEKGSYHVLQRSSSFIDGSKNDDLEQGYRSAVKAFNIV